MDRETLSTILTALQERRNRLISTQVNEGAVPHLRARIQKVNNAIREVNRAIRSSGS